MTKDDLQKVRDALDTSTPNGKSSWRDHYEALRILDAALAAPEPQPFYFGLTRDNTWLSCDEKYYNKLKPDMRMKVYTAPVAAPALDLVADQGFTIFPLAPDLPVPTYYWGGKGEIAEWMICPKCCGKFPISKETVAQLKAAQPAPVAAPEPQQPVAWVSVDDAMPKSGVTVLVCYRNSLGNIRRIRAKWTAAKTVEANAEYDWGEHDEETDTYWTPEGWYECIDNWDEFSSIMVSEGEITHWMPLPLAPDDPNYTAPVAAPDDATDWEGVSADQAMTIAMLRVDYQQLSDLCTRQGIRMMEQEDWQKDAERYRFMRGNESIKFWSRLGELKPIEWDEFIDAAMEQKP